MSHSRFLPFAFCFLFPLAVAAEPWNVRVQTTDGNFVSGEMDLDRFRVETDAGPVDVGAADVQRIDFTPAGVEIRRKDDSIVKGSLARDSWTLKTKKLGVLELKTGLLKAIVVSDRVNPGGGKPGDGTPDANKPAGDDRLYAKPAVEVLGEVRLGGWLVPGGGRAADGASFWIMDGATCKARRIGIDPLKPLSEIKCDAPVIAWSVAPSGRRAIALAGGKMAILDLEKGEIVDRLDVGTGPQFAVLVDDDAAIVTTLREAGSAKAWSLSTRQVSRQIPGCGCRLTRVISGTEVLAPSGFIRVFPADPGGAPTMEWHPRQMHEDLHSQDFSLSLHLMANSTGSIRLLARSHLAINQELAKTDRILATLSLPATHRAILFHPRKATLVALEPFKVISEIKLEVDVFEAVADVSEKTMAIFSTSPRGSRVSDMQTPQGDVFQVRIPE